MGIGGAPEGVLTAAAMRCLNGEIQGQARMPHQGIGRGAPASSMGIADLERVYRTEDLAPGKSIIFAAAGVTDGAAPAGRPLLRRRHADAYARDDDRASSGPIHRHHPRQGRSGRQDPVLRTPGSQVTRFS